MTSNDAKKYVGFAVKLRWSDRKGIEQSDVLHVFNVGFVPLYGPCLITEKGEIRLDRITHCENVNQARIAS